MRDSHVVDNEYRRNGGREKGRRSDVHDAVTEMKSISLFSLNIYVEPVAD